MAPACILWPDRDHQWEAVVPRLQKELPELLVHGVFAAEQCVGPAIWLRCVIAGKIDDVELPSDHVPIIYLPGVSRQDLRAVEECPDPLKPLAELQYRGVIWSQLNAKDWTILAFLKSDQGGLGLDVAQDNDAKSAMQLAFNPEADGILAGAEKLATHEGPWKPVWDRFCEAPGRYETIPAQIRKCKMPMPTLFSRPETHGGWPQWNQDQEDALRQNLLALGQLPPHKAREQILSLAKVDGNRREMVWAEIGDAPLARAMEHLVILAETTQNDLAAGTASDLAAARPFREW